MSTKHVVERFEVGWGDLDGNNHLANRAILDHAADVRLRFFARNGFAGSRFGQLGVGPVLTRDELVYRRELRLLDRFTVDFEVLALSADGSRFAVQNTFRNAEDEVTAIVRSEGVWFDLAARKPTAPPPDLEAAQRAIPRAREFHEIRSTS